MFSRKFSRFLLASNFSRLSLDTSLNASRNSRKHCHTMAAKLPETMLACQIVEYNKPHQIRRIQTPKPHELGPHDLLLKVAVASLCHSDLEYLSGNLYNKLPVTASHEGTGTVVARGSAVTKWQVGDRIMAGQTYGRCGNCDNCNGEESYRHYCPNKGSAMSVERDGAFQEYLVTDAREATRIPDEMSFLTAAPLACAGVTVWRGVLLADLKPGEWIGIVGSGGGLGHLGIQFAKAKGLKVLGVDAREDGIALSKEAGADCVLDARKGRDEVAREALRVTGGKGVAATINVSDAKLAASTACAITKMHGTVIQVALPPDVVIPFSEYIFRDIRVRGSFICSPKEAEEMLQLVVKHNIKVESNIFHGIREIPKVVDMLSKGQYRGKGVIVIDEGTSRSSKL